MLNICNKIEIKKWCISISSTLLSSLNSQALLSHYELPQNILTFGSKAWDFIYFYFLAIGVLRCHMGAFSSCSRLGPLSAVVRRLSLQRLPLFWSTGSRRSGFSSRSWNALLALPHVGSSWSRDQIGVLCIAKQILNHWITREAPKAWDFNSSVPPSKRLRL